MQLNRDGARIRVSDGETVRAGVALFASMFDLRIQRHTLGANRP